MSRRDIITLVKKATGMVVQTGLFSGLRLHDVQTWGAGEDIGPQLLGIYEQELHSTLSNFIGACPTTVINVGCAEGYYAVGLARLLPGACVFAFDCDPRAQEACRANAILNSVEQRVRIEGSCTPARLSDIAAEDPNILLITDCEGCEGTLFSNGGVANALRFANIIIEAHDYFDRSILPTLLRTFSTSHRASVVHSGPRNPHAFSFLDKCSDADKWLLVCENRPELQSWLVCERRVPPQSSAKVPVPKPGPDSTATNASVSRTAAATAVGLLNLQPLVYTVCYGDQVYFDCLSLMLQSLRLFGEYNDDVVVLTDRDESICRRSIDTSTSDKVHFLKVASPDWMTRYSVFDYLGPGDQSLLYIDTDIVIAQSLTPVLQKIDAKTALADIYVCSESAAHQALKGIPASRIDNRFANFFGLELFKNDADLSDCPLLLLNSGLFASTSRSAFKDIAARIRSSYSDGRWSNIAKEHKDQPFFNYAVAKSKLRIDTTFLTDATALLSSADGATRSPPLFAHFAWTWGESKPRAMSQYLTARSTNLPPAVAPSSVQSSREETVPTVVQPSKEDSGLPAEPAHKARKGLICDLDWITTYFVREHYHLVQLLQLEYGFEIIDSKTTDFHRTDVVEKLNTYDVTVIAHQGLTDIPIEQFSSYKIFSVHDLVNYNEAMDNFLARMIAAADMVISPYAYTVKDHFEHCNIVWLPYSAAIEASAASANIGFNENPICKVLVSGSLAWDRPFRQYAANVKSEHIDVLPHPGYGTRYGDDAPEIIGARYFHELNKYLCCFTDAHKYRYLHLKNFEIASVGSLLLTDKLIEPEMNQLGFVDYETCIFASPDNFVEKVSWICDDRNRETVDQIRRAGMQLVKERHLTRHRARQLNDIVDNVILRESRSRITELQHTERENTAMATQPIDKKTESSKSDSGYEDAPILSRVYMGEDLLKWQVAHAMKVRLWDGGIVVSDSTQYDWHLLRIHDTEFLYRLVRIRCLLKKLATSTKNFYVHHYGLKDVAEIGLDGTIVNNGISRLLSVTPRSGDLLEIEIEYLSCHSTISIGCSSDRHPVYTGSGLEQFIILRIEVETRDATQELSRVPQEERIRIVDVGAAEGLQLKWMLNADRVTPVLFEPISADAETLRQTVGRIPGAVVIESALAHTSGPNKLYVAQASGCSSLREPDFGLLSRYSIGKIFRTIRTEKVNCTRYDELFRQQVAPSPDVIKIDAQGFEYEVLLGFGQLLESCLGIELETHFYPVYRGQRLVGDIVEFLAEFGFVLRALRHVPNFDGDCVEFDAFFTKRRHDVLTFSESVKRKFALLTEIWELAPYF